MLTKERKDAIFADINKTIQRNNMSLGQVNLIFKEKGYEDKRTKSFFAEVGIEPSYEDFLEISKEIDAIIGGAKERMEEQKQKEDAAPRLEDITKNLNLISNTKVMPLPQDDLLSKVKVQQQAVSVASYITDGVINPAEPPAEEVQLPSRGKFYNNILAATQGKILLRPMAYKEEQVMTTERLLKTGESFDIIFRNCIKTAGIDTTQLLSSDRAFLLFYLRAISYGPEYTLMAQDSQKNSCPVKININELEITHPPEAMESEPFHITLPVAKKKIVFKLSRGVDEIELIKLSSFGKKGEENNLFLQRLVQLTLDIEDVAKPKWESFYTYLIGRDMSHIRQTLEIIDFGYKLNKTYTSPFTGEDLRVALTVNENFFRSEG